MSHFLLLFLHVDGKIVRSCFKISLHAPSRQALSIFLDEETQAQVRKTNERCNDREITIVYSNQCLDGKDTC